MKCQPGCGCSRHRPERRSPTAVQDRFWSKVDKRGPDECWLWTGSLNTPGYAALGVEGKTYNSAHRLAYEWLVGPIPEGMHLDHLCRNRSCVNPAHLEPVTCRENILRGTNPPAQQARQTHCKRGHEFTPENTYRAPSDNRRHCRTCQREWMRSIRTLCSWCGTTIKPGRILPPSHGICEPCAERVYAEVAA